MILTLSTHSGRVRGSLRWVVRDTQGRERIVELVDPQEVPGRYATPAEILHGFFRLIALLVTGSVNPYIVWKALYSGRKKR